MRNRILVFAILFGIAFAGLAPAQTQNNNDPLKIISNRPRPNVLFLVDTSGSMLWDTILVGGSEICVRLENQNGTVNELLYPNFSSTSDTMNSLLVDSDNPRSRMGQAKIAMREMFSQIQDVNIGLGRFKRELKLNRFRATLPANLSQGAKQSPQHNYTYWDNQALSSGMINIPMNRIPKTGGSLEYPFCRLVRNDGGVYWSWDATDTVWSTEVTDTAVFEGRTYIRMNWWYSYIEDARHQMFSALTDDGSFIYRGDYNAPDANHRNKLNQVDNVDIFLTDAEMIQLKANTADEAPLTVVRHVDTVYGVIVNADLTFTYYPTIADWSSSYSCSGGELLIDIQDRFQDDFATAEDESNNRRELLAATKRINTNAKIYDFRVDPPTLTKTGPLFGMGSTPIGTTLETAKNYFANSIIPRDQGNAVDSCRENFIILLTDGLETCGGNPEAVALDLYTNYGIKVYVIAFVANTTQADGIASAGGTEQAFSAENKDELVQALQTIFSEIRQAVELSAPVAVTSSAEAGDFIEGNVALLPFFDFPGFYGRLQARKIFKIAVVAIDPKTGAIETDGSGNPVIIEDDISDARVLALVNDPDNPISKDPTKEIVGLQLDPPQFWWDAGELVSYPYIDDPEALYTYEHLKPDTGDMDGDSDTAELIINPAYKSADSRRIMTALDYTSVNMTTVNFDPATLIDDGANHDTAKALLNVSTWTDQEARFLINFARGKSVQRFIEETTIYGQTFAAGDPMPDPATPDNDGDGVPDGFIYNERRWKLGDFISGTPVLVKAPSGTYPLAIDDDANEINDYEEFTLANANMPALVIAGGNDGMIHAFSLSGIDLNSDNDFDDANEYYPGEEVWAFVLPDTMHKLKELFYDSLNDDDYESDGQRINPHQYFADGQITLSVARARVHNGDTDGDGVTTDPEFRLMMFLGEGRGGNRYWAFDMTDPMDPEPIWSFSDITMGRSMSKPAVGAVEVGSDPDLDNDTFKYYVFMGSGYADGQTDGSAAVGNVMYKVDINNGTLVDSRNVGDVAGGAGLPNAIISRAILVDEDDDFFVERCYVGDLDGNIWRWGLIDGTLTNILADGANPLTSEEWRLNRPIPDSITHGNIFGFHVITATTGGDTRMYIDANNARATYPQQTIYLIADTDNEGNIRSLLDGVFLDDGSYEDSGSTVGIDLPDFVVGENQPVMASYTEYDEEGKIYRGFQVFYPVYTPDPLGLCTIRCSFGSSDLLILDSIFSEGDIVSSTTGSLIDMGEGKATGITYTGGNILFAIGDQFKVYGSGVYRFEASQRVKARLKVLSWREIF